MRSGNIIEEFFQSAGQDEEIQDKFQMLTNNIKNTKDNKVAKEMLLRELSNLATKKGYDITQEDFEEFFRNNGSELAENYLEQASGGRGGIASSAVKFVGLAGAGAGVGLGGSMLANSMNKQEQKQDVQENVRENIQDTEDEENYDYDDDDDYKKDNEREDFKFTIPYTGSNRSKEGRKYISPFEKMPSKAAVDDMFRVNKKGNSLSDTTKETSKNKSSKENKAPKNATNTKTNKDNVNTTSSVTSSLSTKEIVDKVKPMLPEAIQKEVKDDDLVKQFSEAREAIVKNRTSNSGVDVDRVAADCVIANITNSEEKKFDVLKRVDLALQDIFGKSADEVAIEDVISKLANKLGIKTEALIRVVNIERIEYAKRDKSNEIIEGKYEKEAYPVLDIDNIQLYDEETSLEKDLEVKAVRELVKYWYHDAMNAINVVPIPGSVPADPGDFYRTFKKFEKEAIKNTKDYKIAMDLIGERVGTIFNGPENEHIHVNEINKWALIDQLEEQFDLEKGTLTRGLYNTYGAFNDLTNYRGEVEKEQNLFVKCLKSIVHDTVVNIESDNITREQAKDISMAISHRIFAKTNMGQVFSNCENALSNEKGESGWKDGYIHLLDAIRRIEKYYGLRTGTLEYGLFDTNSYQLDAQNEPDPLVKLLKKIVFNFRANSAHSNGMLAKDVFDRVIKNMESTVSDFEDVAFMEKRIELLNDLDRIAQIYGQLYEKYAESSGYVGRFELLREVEKAYGFDDGSLTRGFDGDYAALTEMETNTKVRNLRYLLTELIYHSDRPGALNWENRSFKVHRYYDGKVSCRVDETAVKNILKALQNPQTASAMEKTITNIDIDRDVTNFISGFNDYRTRLGMSFEDFVKGLDKEMGLDGALVKGLGDEENYRDRTEDETNDKIKELRLIIETVSKYAGKYGGITKDDKEIIKEVSDAFYKGSSSDVAYDSTYEGLGWNRDFSSNGEISDVAYDSAYEGQGFNRNVTVDSENKEKISDVAYSSAYEGQGIDRNTDVAYSSAREDQGFNNNGNNADNSQGAAPSANQGVRENQENNDNLQFSPALNIGNNLAQDESNENFKENLRNKISEALEQTGIINGQGHKVYDAKSVLYKVAEKFGLGDVKERILEKATGNYEYNLRKGVVLYNNEEKLVEYFSKLDEYMRESRPENATKEAGDNKLLLGYEFTNILDNM